MNVTTHMPQTSGKKFLFFLFGRLVAYYRALRILRIRESRIPHFPQVMILEIKPETGNYFLVKHVSLRANSKKSFVDEEVQIKQEFVPRPGDLAFLHPLWMQSKDHMINARVFCALSQEEISEKDFKEKIVEFLSDFIEIY